MNRQPVATASHYYHQPHHAYGGSHAVHHHPADQQSQQLQQYHDPGFASLGYRPLQLPLQQQQQSPIDQRLSLATAGYQTPNFRHDHQTSALPLRTRRQTRRTTRQQQVTMTYQQTPEDELAELQKLSNEYEPEATVRFLVDNDVIAR